MGDQATSVKGKGKASPPPKGAGDAVEAAAVAEPKPKGKGKSPPAPKGAAPDVGGLFAAIRANKSIDEDEQSPTSNGMADATSEPQNAQPPAAADPKAKGKGKAKAPPVPKGADDSDAVAAS